MAHIAGRSVAVIRKTLHQHSHPAWAVAFIVQRLKIRAANLAGAGIPTVVWGPGDIAQAHTADEWITLEQLERGTDMLTRFLLSLP